MQTWTQYKEAQTPEDVAIGAAQEIKDHIRTGTVKPEDAISFLSWMREQDNTPGENVIIDAAIIDILSTKWAE